MRRAAVLFVTTAAVLLFVGLLLTHSLYLVERIAFVSDVQGAVQVRAPDARDFTPLTREARVQAGSVLRTGAGGEVQIGWADGTRVRVAPNSVLTILKCRLDKRSGRSVSLLQLDAGKIWTRVIRSLQAQSKFEVCTPTATAGVRGTTFSVEVQPGGGTVVSVWEGTVEATTDGQAVAVEGGTEVTLQGASPEARRLSDKQRRAWEQAEMTGPLLRVDGLQAKGTNVTCRGRTDPGATVTVQGQPLKVDDEGCFSQVVVLDPSRPVQFVAKDAKGETRLVRNPAGDTAASPGRPAAKPVP